MATGEVEPVTAYESAERLDKAPPTIHLWALRPDIGDELAPRGGLAGKRALELLELGEDGRISAHGRPLEAW